MPVHVPTDPIVAAALASAAVDTGVPSDLVHGVAWVESRYKPHALSPNGAMGLMQLMPGTALGLGVSDPYNPVANANAGARFLKQLYRTFGGDMEAMQVPSPAWELALGAYNWGPAHVQKHRDPLQWPAQVKGYVLNVWRATGWPLPFEVEQRLMSRQELHDMAQESRSSRRRS